MNLSKILIIFIQFLILINSTTQIDKLGVILIYDFFTTPDQLQKYISGLTKTQCNIITEINIIVQYNRIKNVQKVVDQSFASVQNVKINIVRHQQNKPFLKFKPIKQSKSDYYFIGNLNSTQSCQQISQFLQYASKYAISGIIPLIGEDQHTSAMRVDLKVHEPQIFLYHKYANSKYYQMVENIRFVSRHIMEVAATNIREVQAMSKGLITECQEIYLNFIIVHFYPQFRNKIYRFPNNLKTKFEKTQNDLKNKCMRQYIDILGYVPVFYQKRGPEPNLWKNPNHNKIIDLKKMMLERQIATSQGQQTRLLHQSPPPEVKQMVHSESPLLTINYKLISSILATIAVIQIITLIILLSLIKKSKNKLLLTPLKSQNFSLCRVK